MGAAFFAALILSLSTMKKIRVVINTAFLFLQSIAFSQTVKELQDNAMSFMQQGDFANAILILNKASQIEPNNIDITKQIALAYYYQKDNAKALETIKPILEREDADDQCYQIASNIYKQLAQPKECEKLLKRGI